MERKGKNPYWKKKGMPGRLLAFALFCMFYMACSINVHAEESDWEYFQYIYDNNRIGIRKYKGNDEEVEVPATYKGWPVTSIDAYAFQDNTVVTKVKLPEGITKIDSSAFKGCTNLESICLPEGITEIGNYAFADCTSLESIYLPDSITKIGYSAFRGCTGLETITLPKGLVCVEDCLFQDCSSLTRIDLQEGIKSIKTSVIENCTRIETIEFPNTLEEIGKSAFKGSNLTAIQLPTGLTSIRESAFENCLRLESIDYVPGGIRSNMNIGERAFQGCKALSSAAFPEGLVSIGESAFSQCTSLTELTLPKGLEGIGKCAFSGCTSLKKAVLQEGLVSLGNRAFQSCGSLTDISLPEGLVDIGDYAFYYCGSLTKAALPEGLMKLGRYAFDSCESLTDISLPASLLDIGDYAFCRCGSLTSVTFPEGSAKLERIGDYAFAYCWQLLCVQVPASVTAIGERTFEVHASDLVLLVGRDSAAENYAKDNGYTYRYIGDTTVEIVTAAIPAKKAIDRMARSTEREIDGLVNLKWADISDFKARITEQAVELKQQIEEVGDVEAIELLVNSEGPERFDEIMQEAKEKDTECYNTSLAEAEEHIKNNIAAAKERIDSLEKLTDKDARKAELDNLSVQAMSKLAQAKTRIEAQTIEGEVMQQVTDMIRLAELDNLFASYQDPDEQEKEKLPQLIETKKADIDSEIEKAEAAIDAMEGLTAEEKEDFYIQIIAVGEKAEEDFGMAENKEAVQDIADEALASISGITDKARQQSAASLQQAEEQKRLEEERKAEEQRIAALRREIAFLKERIDSRIEDEKTTVDSLLYLTEEEKAAFKEELEEEGNRAKEELDGAESLEDISGASYKATGNISNIVNRALSWDAALRKQQEEEERKRLEEEKQQAEKALRDAKSAAGIKIDRSAAEVKEAIDLMNELADERKGIQKSEVDWNVKHAKQNIQIATSAADVEAAKEEGLARISKVKSMAEKENIEALEKRREEDAQKRQEEQKRLEEEQKRQEELKRLKEEQKRLEEEKRQEEEERLAEERRRRDEQELAEMLLKLQEEVKRQEEQQKQAEQKRLEELQKRREEEQEYLEEEKNIPLQDCQVQMQEDIYAFTGEEITPEPVISFQEQVLEEDSDYILEYSNNINIGTAEIVVSAIGDDYTGSCTVQFTIVPPAPEKIKAKRTGKGVRLTWKKVSALKPAKSEKKASGGYYVYRSTKKNSGYQCIKTIKSYKTVSFTDRKAKKGKKYYYKVVAYKKVGNKIYRSADSKMVKK